MADEPIIDAEFAGKKKKKKEKAVIFDDEQPKAETEPPAEAAEDESLDFLKSKKKKKKPEKSAKLDEEATTAASQEATGQENVNPDYSYDELLTRVYNIMREKNPGFDAGEKKKFVMRPPAIGKAGSKKTAFSNFAEICKLLKRPPKHMLAFLLAELGTSGSIDGSNQLIIKGRFQQKHIENVLRKYIKEYVTCHTCKSAETELAKDTRLFFLECKTCGSRCSVASIKTGFQAQTTKRSVMRNAAAQQ